MSGRLSLHSLMRGVAGVTCARGGARVMQPRAHLAADAATMKAAAVSGCQAMRPEQFFRVWLCPVEWMICCCLACAHVVETVRHNIACAVAVGQR
jgi:hypothetical protein